MTNDTKRRSRLLPAFEMFAYLHRPADPGPSSWIVEADDAWSIPDAPSADIDQLLWGRLALNTRPTPALLLQASRRELAVRRLRARPPGDLRLAELHRLAPARRPGAVRGTIRSVTLGGVLAELTRGERGPRVIDEVVAAAGADPGQVRLRPSGDGSALASVTVAETTPAELRVAKVGHPKDPPRGHAGLLALAAADVPLVPRPLGTATTAGAAWTTETALTGRHVRSLTPDLLSQIVRFLARLPSADGATGRRPAMDDHLAELAEVFPEHAAAFSSIAAAGARWGAELRPVFIHGDLWLNNIFARDDTLSGVFDWNTWHPAGLPAIDLLNLLAAEERTRTGIDVGQLLVDEYWRSPAVVDTLGTYFRARGERPPDAAGIAAIAAGWWSSRIADTIHRALRQIDDPAWVERNVVAALSKFESLERELG